MEHEPTGEPCIPISELREQIARIIHEKALAAQIIQSVADTTPPENPQDGMRRGLDTAKYNGTAEAMTDIRDSLFAWLDERT